MKSGVKSFLCGVLAVFLLCLAGLCLWTRTSGFDFPASRAVLAAAALTMPDGNIPTVTVTDSSSATESTSASAFFTEPSSYATATHDETIYSEDPTIYDSQVHFPVIESLYSSGEFGYNDFFVKNTTSYNPDIGEYLASPLGFDFEKSDKIQVLIYHTHTSESYITYDAGYYHESFYPRSTDNERNMIRVGEAIAEGLRKQGIGVVHATEVHDSPEYTGAYTRSRNTIEKYLEQYPDIKVVLDIHRDSISYGSDGGKIKPTFTHNGNKAAQIMIMSGYDGAGTRDFPFWEENLTFALKLQDTAEKMYPGMTRPLYFGNFAYNMNVNNGSLLIEVGTDVNTLSEAVYTGELLANVLAKVLQSG
ncbi:MAG: stage II sporulation protein P [Clostridia bacterium]|nr:stage II sporulation protein P [Clostridia bacterium]